jgi:hypothetical protein
VRARERKAFKSRSRKPASAGQPSRVAPINPREKCSESNPVLHDGVAHDGQRDERFRAQAELFVKDFERVGVGTPHLDAWELPKPRIDDAGRSLADEELVALLEDKGDGVSRA